MLPAKLEASGPGEAQPHQEARLVHGGGVRWAPQPGPDYFTGRNKPLPTKSHATHGLRMGLDVWTLAPQSPPPPSPQQFTRAALPATSDSRA